MNPHPRFRIRVAAFVCLSLSWASAFEARDTPPLAVSVTYLANEGFLLAAGPLQVLIDGLFDDGIDGYPAVPEAIRQRLEAGSGPWAVIDLVLATHHHGDHFDAIDVRVLNLHHGDRDPPGENLGYVVTIEDTRILHFGDTEATLEDFRPYIDELQDADIALLPFGSSPANGGSPSCATNYVRAALPLPTYSPDLATPPTLDTTKANNIGS